MSDKKRIELLELIPLYVLGTLSPLEREQVEALLSTDIEAQILLQQYQQIEAEVLPLWVEHREPPPTLKSRLMQSIQEPATEQIKPAMDMAEQGGWYSRRGFIAAAAALVIVLGGLLFYEWAIRAAPEQLYERLVADSRSQRIAITPHLSDDIRGELIIAADGKQAIIKVEDLPPLPDDQIFQLWLINDRGAVSGGTYDFRTPGTHYLTLPLTDSAYAYQRFGVSQEPIGGSPYADRPSGPRVFDVTVTPPTG